MYNIMHLEERGRQESQERRFKDASKQEEKELEAFERQLEQMEGETDQGANYPYEAGLKN